MPFNLPWDWSADYQKQTCLVLNRSNFIVAYMHRDAHFILKKKKIFYPKIKNIYFYCPRYILPFRRFRTVEVLNQIICIYYIWFRFGIYKKTILWIFDPLFYFYSNLNTKIVSIYDCVDYHWSRNWQENNIIRNNEKKLIRSCSVFLVNSQVLYNIHKNIRVPYIVPVGFSIGSFKSSFYKIPSLIFPNGKPVIGYIGSIDYRIDYDLLFKLIQNNLNLNFIFVGPLHIDENDFEIKPLIDHLFSLNNVYYYKKVSRKYIPYIINKFDICIIPYNLKYDINKYCFPMKFFEYSYLKKPIISTRIKVLHKFKKIVKFGSTVQEWESNINFYLFSCRSTDEKNVQHRLALKNSWNEKIISIEKYLNL